jgi:prepilin-type N-terminal cleavage/methylation domain-containing protein
MKRNDGFTIIEGMIVVCILAILAAIAIPAFQHHNNPNWRPQNASSFVECKSAIDNTDIRSPMASGWRQEQHQNGYYSIDDVNEDFYPRQGDVCIIHNQ